MNQASGRFEIKLCFLPKSRLQMARKSKDLFYLSLHQRPPLACSNQLREMHDLKLLETA
jgi:hypothetical protein